VIAQTKPEVIPVFPDLPGVRAFFTTRRGGESQGSYASLNLSLHTGDDPERVRGNWRSLLESQELAEKSLAIPRLCHGAEIREIQAPDPDSPPPLACSPEATDAVFARVARFVLAVTLGDCQAALIADPETRCVAAVHAGWRGSRDGILGKTLRLLFASGYCRPESTRVALGPCLSVSALEVSADTAATLPADHVQSREGRFHFDLRSCNRAQALEAGAEAGHITEVGGCTRTDSGDFFSYRRDGAASGRMAAVIALL
jgi:YfiH family protein